MLDSYSKAPNLESLITFDWIVFWTSNVDSDIILLKKAYPENFIEIRLRDVIMTSCSRILLKFSGKVFFSYIMARSKFEVKETIQSKVINDFRFGALLYESSMYTSHPVD